MDVACSRCYIVAAMPDSEFPAAPRPRSRWKLIFSAVALLILLYAISPYYSIWRFGETLKSHDMNALAERVDFPEVRGSLKKQIRDHFQGVLQKKKNDLVSQLLTSSGPSLVDQLIDAYVTPDGLATIISNPAPIKNASSLSALSSGGVERRPIEWSKARRAFFTSPRDFAVDHEGIKLRFRFNGLGWKLREIDLELDAPKASGAE
jgi:Protein of unknown function (DUF2939)